MKKISLLFAVVLVCVLAFTFSWTENTDAQAFKVNPQGESRRQAVFAELIQTARQTGEIRVIVRLQNELKAIGKMRQPELARHKSEIKQSQGDFLSRHKNRRVEKVTNFEFIPFVAFETDAATLEQMKNDPNIISIEKDEFDEPHLAESTEVIGAPTSWTSGFSGLGQNIVILDTGVDKTHPFLAGKVVSEACFSTSASSQGIESLCPGGATQSTAEGSGVNCDPAITSCSHGTHVAGIAAGRGQNFSGVAKDANIIAMQVFSKGTTSERCGNGTPPCTISVVSDQIRA
ncbi:MAG TPA: S8 family serine peptidase, partial [Pyrinomonadaceae bacterium]|nr:S8 family serine peptidase [Pyrinomonadaceae bacterium]